MQAHAERSGGDLGRFHSPGAAKESILFMILSYAQGEY
jgi:hypothetical protein